MGDRLKKARRLAGLKRQPLTHLALLPDGSAILGIERGERIPRLDTVERIAYALGLSPAFLAYGIEGEAGPLAKGLRCEGVAQRLADTRAARSLTMRALARLAGLTDTAVRSTETGSSVPTVATLEAFAHALEVSPAWLAFGVGDKEAQRTRRRPRADGAAASLVAKLQLDAITDLLAEGDQVSANLLLTLQEGLDKLIWKLDSHLL